MPFGGSRPNYVKLRTNLRICINRLKLLEKKKTELALKSRREIADYIQAGKDDRARIRVEHIIREDYMVESMEILEMFADLLLARFGIIEKMKEMDPALEEPIASILWAAPRLMTDVPELVEVSKQLTIKYGKEFADASKINQLEMVNEKVLVKMGVAAPPKKLIEQYMIAIAKSFNVPFEPDPSAMVDDQIPDVATLIDLGFDGKNSGAGAGGHGGSGGGGGGGGGIPAGMVDTMPAHPPQGFIPPQPPMGNTQNHAPPFTLPPPPQFPGQHSHPGGSYPAQGGSYPAPPAGSYPAAGGGIPGGPPPLPNQPPNAMTGSAPPHISTQPPAGSVQPPPPAGYYDPHNAQNTARLPSYNEVLDEDASALKKPGTGSFQSQTSDPTAPPASSDGYPSLPAVPPAGNSDPTLPSVPTDHPGGASVNDDIDFDDLTKRFEELKKKR